MPGSVSATITATGLLLALAACSSGKGAGPGASPDHPVAGQLRLRRSVVLQQPDSAMIGQVTGLEIGPHGEILIADLVQTNAKLYDSTGRLLRIMGGLGDGPGEFRFPRYPRFGASGHILVAEGRGFIEEFSSSGAWVRTMRPAGLLVGFRRLDDGDLLTMGFARDGVALIRYDSSGAHPDTLFTRHGVPVADGPDSPRWDGLNYYYFAQVADTAWVVAALSDTLWKVNVRTGETSAAIMSFPGLTPPRLPPASAPAGFDWADAFYRSWHPMASPGLVAIPFQRGFPTENEGQAALVWSEATGWIAVQDAPLIVGAAHGDVVALADDDSGMVRLDFLTPVGVAIPE